MASPQATIQNEGARRTIIGRRSGRVHPAWELFVRFCEQLGHGEIERLKIQDGLPVLAEVTTKKVKFSS